MIKLIETYNIVKTIYETKPNSNIKINKKHKKNILELLNFIKEIENMEPRLLDARDIIDPKLYTWLIKQNKPIENIETYKISINELIEENLNNRHKYMFNFIDLKNLKKKKTYYKLMRSNEQKYLILLNILKILNSLV